MFEVNDLSRVDEISDSRRDLICFGREWHARVWFTPQWVVSHLTKWYRILYVTKPFYGIDLLRDVWAHRLPRGGLEVLGENLSRYAPPKYLPLNYRFPAIERAFRRFRLAHLKMVCRRMNIRRPILLLWEPEFQDMVGHFNESLLCYFVDDQYSLFTGAKPTAAEEESILVKAADLVLCISAPLCEDKRRFNPNVHLVEEAVDYSLFSGAALPHLPVPSEFDHIRRPILGFIGSLVDKVDYDLLNAIAIDNPDWSLVLVGPDNIFTSSDRDRFNRLLTCGNVKWLGFRPVQQLPAYLKGMDVCAIPNKVNEFNKYIFPLKLYEYLAAGKPIISTDIPSVRSFEGLVRIARSIPQWRRHMLEALEEVGMEWTVRRQRVASQNTWEKRAERINSLLTGSLEERAVHPR